MNVDPNSREVNLQVLAIVLGVNIQEVRWSDLESRYDGIVLSEPGWPHRLQPGVVSEMPPALQERYTATVQRLVAEKRKRLPRKAKANAEKVKVAAAAKVSASDSTNTQSPKKPASTPAPKKPRPATSKKKRKVISLKKKVNS